MTDEIRTYHVEDDPSNVTERRFGAFPAINPLIPTSLPQYVIPPVADSLYFAMRYYWYSVYQQGIADQKLLHQQQLLHRHDHQLLNPPQQQLLHQHQRDQQLISEPHLSQLQPLQRRQDQRQLDLSPVSPSSSTQRSPPNALLQLHQRPHHHHHQSPPQQQLSQRIDEGQSNSNSGSSSSSTLSNDLNSIDARDNRRQASTEPINQNHQNQQQNHRPTTENHQHIKKPLNPFMIYMQKRRPEIVRQGIIKESAAINQLLGQQWRELTKEEQAPYYKLAEQEKILHAQKYPGWSARDNYANQKKRKKMRLKSISLNGLDQSDKKCRARFGLSNMVSWCKPCKRKKKCIYSTPHNNNTNGVSNNHHLHHHQQRHLNHLAHQNGQTTNILNFPP